MEEYKLWLMDRILEEQNREYIVQPYLNALVDCLVKLNQELCCRYHWLHGGQCESL